MKKYWILILMSCLALFSCTEDTSAYLPQDKDIVGIDSIKKNENGDNPGESDEKALTPGIHLVKLNVLQADGQTVERRFKYYMPISINQAKPISLIFEFHGSYEYDASIEAPDPIAGISNGNSLIQHAIKENCIIVFPAGENVVSSDKGYVNWQNSENHLPFVDKMIEFFKDKTPLVDFNRVYSTGQSSGAIFSFVLAFERSTVFAAVTPRAGQMSLANETRVPERAVAIRVFAGEDDDIVVHDEGVVKNMTMWAEKIGGYFAGDMVMSEEPFQIENYKMVDTRKWSGGNADLEIYTLKGEGHGISLGFCMPYMWEFMKSHPLDLAPVDCFLHAGTTDFEAFCGQKITIPFNYTDGATITTEGLPADWNPVIENKTIKLTAPADYDIPGTEVNRNGTFTIKADNGGKKASVTIKYKLNAPKSFFEIGDLYYNADFEPVGIVCWVNNKNIKEAKIVSLEAIKEITYNNTNINSYLGATFETPDKTDGEGNTQKMVDKNATLRLPSTAANSAFMWANAYSYKSVSGWYLPAINEYKDLAVNVDQINKILESLSGKKIEGNIYSSTVEVYSNGKNYYYYDFAKKQEMKKFSASENPEKVVPRAMKKVTK